MSRLHLHVYCLQDDTLCVLAATDPQHSDRKKTCLEWSKVDCSRVIQSGYTQFSRVPKLGSYLNNDWQLLEIGLFNRICMWCWIWDNQTRQDSASEVCLNLKPEQLNTPRHILWVILECTSCILQYDISTPYHLDCLSIPGWLQIYCAGSVS